MAETYPPMSALQFALSLRVSVFIHTHSYEVDPAVRVDVCQADGCTEHAVIAPTQDGSLPRVRTHTCPHSLWDLDGSLVKHTTYRMDRQHTHMSNVKIDQSNRLMSYQIKFKGHWNIVPKFTRTENIKRPPWAVFTLLLASDQNLLDSLTHFEDGGAHVGDLSTKPKTLHKHECHKGSFFG